MLFMIAAVITSVFINNLSADVVSVCESENDYDISREHNLAAVDTSIHKTLSDIRSVVECVTYCHADVDCQSAIYRKNKNCILLDANVAVSEADSTNQVTDAYITRVLQLGVTCPSPCTGDAVCVLDCTSDVENPEPVCVVLSGTQESCAFSPFIQSKEFYLTNISPDQSTNDYHIFFSVSFMKTEEWTTLRVKLRGTLQGGYDETQMDSYGWWKITFNGSLCIDPGSIESLHYNADGSVSHQKAAGIQGICKGLPAGLVEIGLVLDDDTSSEFRIGYAVDATRLYVEEIGLDSAHSGLDEVTTSECPNLPVFNTREETATFSSLINDNSQAIWTVEYRKLENDTSLRINLNFVIGMSATESSCAMWYIYIDGSHCQPAQFGVLLALLDDPTLILNETQSVEAEGYCEGVSAGIVQISLHVDLCPQENHTVGDVYTGGFNTVQRMIIEEFKPQSNINAVMSRDGQNLYRVPQMNIVTYSTDEPSGADVDNGEVWVLDDYQKVYSNSGLSLSLSGVSRILKSSSNKCCRHYFMVNDAECSDPGPIEGVHYLNIESVNYHSPIFIEGICEGIPTGPVKIALHTGECVGGAALGDCYFGWNSVTHVMVSESYVDRETIP